MSKRAKEEALSALHAALAGSFKDILENGEMVIDKETGEAVRMKPGASMMNAIRQFLKDNSITADPTTSAPLRDLGASLPDHFEPDEFGVPN